MRGRLDRIDAAWVAGCGALYATLVLPRLASRAVWTDEAFTVGATRDLIGTWRHTGGTMALYYLVVTPVVRLSDARFWLRLPSAVFAVATIAVLYLVARRIGSRFQAIVASGLLAVTWSLGRWGVEARGYSLAMLLVAVAWLALVSAATESDDGARTRWWRLYGVAMVAAPLAHGLTALQFPVQVLALLLWPGRRQARTTLLVVGGALVVEGLGLFAVGAGEVASWIQPLSWRDAKKISRLMFGRGVSQWVVAAAVLAATVLVVAGFVRDRADRRTITSGAADARWSSTVAVLWAWGLPLTILAISVVRPYQEARYLSSSLPAVALLVSSLVVRAPRRAAVGVFVVLAGLLALDQPAVTTVAGENWPGLAHQVDAQAAAGDLVLSEALVRAPFDYAYHEMADPTPLSPLSPTDPIGVTRRLYRAAPGTMRERVLGASGHDIWWVARGQSQAGAVHRVLADPAVAARYDLADHWRYNGALQLFHLTPKPGARAGT
ncbi:MAG: glycosyltransferase family 39 protein [Acidimicrobiales bacterium]